MPVSQPSYPVTIDLQASTSAAWLFSPFPTKILSGTSFKVVATVKEGSSAADLTGCTAVMKARPQNAVIGVAAVTLATGSISTNVITFDCGAGTIPSEWQSYTKQDAIAVWFEVTEAASGTQWQREAYCQIIDATHVGSADVNGTAVIEEETGGFSLTSDMSGKEICFNGGAITIPSLPAGTTIVLNNTSASASAAIIVSGVTARREASYAVNGATVLGYGSVSITYRTTGECFVRGSLS